MTSASGGSPSSDSGGKAQAKHVQLHLQRMNPPQQFQHDADRMRIEFQIPLEPARDAYDGNVFDAEAARRGLQHALIDQLAQLVPAQPPALVHLVESKPMLLQNDRLDPFRAHGCVSDYLASRGSNRDTSASCW